MGKGYLCSPPNARPHQMHDFLQSLITTSNSYSLLKTAVTELIFYRAINYPIKKLFYYFRPYCLKRWGRTTLWPRESLIWGPATATLTAPAAIDESASIERGDPSSGSMSVDGVFWSRFLDFFWGFLTNEEACLERAFNVTTFLTTITSFFRISRFFWRLSNIEVFIRLSNSFWYCFLILFFVYCTFFTTLVSLLVSYYIWRYKTIFYFTSFRY